MLFWVAVAIMSAVAIAAVLWPFVRRTRAAPSGSDVAVYRDQLDEIERDRAAGTIGAAEAEAARLEISRRLLAAADLARQGGEAEDKAGRADDAPSWRAVAAALLALPAGALALYLALGSPGLPGQPLGERVARAHGTGQSVATLLMQVETHLRDNPDDGRGWDAVAPIYMRLGRYDDAVRANRNVLRLLGPTAEREAALGEALVNAANGMVTAEARAAFDRALALDSRDIAARFFVGLAAEQDGRQAEAAQIWRGLIAEAPADAPWLGLVQSALARVEGAGGAPLAAGPGEQDAAAAAALPAAEQDEMARDMVRRLAERLKENSADAQGWQRLVRSYLVLGDRDSAVAAAADARRALGEIAYALQGIDGLLQEGARPAPRAAAPAAPHPAVAPAPHPAMSPAPVPDHGGHDDTTRRLVARLADRLKNDGSDLDGWVQLVQSYIVLGERDKARAAATDARRALENDPDRLRRLDEFLKGAKLDG